MATIDPTQLTPDQLAAIQNRNALIAGGTGAVNTVGQVASQVGQGLGQIATGVNNALPAPGGLGNTGLSGIFALGNNPVTAASQPVANAAVSPATTPVPTFPLPAAAGPDWSGTTGSLSTPAVAAAYTPPSDPLALPAPPAASINGQPAFMTSPGVTALAPASAPAMPTSAIAAAPRIRGTSAGGGATDPNAVEIIRGDQVSYDNGSGQPVSGGGTGGNPVEVVRGDNVSYEGGAGAPVAAAGPAASPYSGYGVPGVGGGASGLTNPYAGASAGFAHQEARADSVIGNAMAYINGAGNMFDRASRAHALAPILAAALGPNNAGQVYGQGADAYNAAAGGVAQAGINAGAQNFRTSTEATTAQNALAEKGTEFANTTQPGGSVSDTSVSGQSHVENRVVTPAQLSGLVGAGMVAPRSTASASSNAVRVGARIANHPDGTYPTRDGRKVTVQGGVITAVQ